MKYRRDSEMKRKIGKKIGSFSNDDGDVNENVKKAIH